MVVPRVRVSLGRGGDQATVSGAASDVRSDVGDGGNVSASETANMRSVNTVPTEAPLPDRFQKSSPLGFVLPPPRFALPPLGFGLSPLGFALPMRFVLM